MNWFGHVGHLGGKVNAYKVLVGKPEERKPLERHSNRWEHNIHWILKNRMGA
jgi:hypothetical protein